MSTAPNLPATINPARARLPQTYQAARQALTECSSIDECKDWADKAQALGSYARQSNDDTLHKLADRIKARAVRRCGQLMEQFQTGPKGGKPKTNGAGGGPVSQRSAAETAGLSRRQEKTAVRVANVPKDQFDAAVNGDDPPGCLQFSSPHLPAAPPVGSSQSAANRLAGSAHPGLSSTFGVHSGGGV